MNTKKGCLSLPTQYAKVEDQTFIEIYQDENGKKN